MAASRESPLFEMELDDIRTPAPATDAPPDLPAIQLELHQLLRPQSDAEREVADTVRMCLEALHPSNPSSPGQQQAVDLDQLAARLALRGLTLSVRAAPGGCHGRRFEQLAYRFLSLEQPGAEGGGREGRECIVDPNFKEQFCCPLVQHTWYGELLAAVPALFVGQAERLVAIVRLLCRALDAALRATGNATPPWRRQDALVTKWLPRTPADCAAGPEGPGTPRTRGRSQGGSSPRAPRPARRRNSPQRSVRGFACAACDSLAQTLGCGAAVHEGQQQHSSLDDLERQLLSEAPAPQEEQQQAAGGGQRQGSGLQAALGALHLGERQQQQPQQGCSGGWELPPIRKVPLRRTASGGR